MGVLGALVRLLTLHFSWGHDLRVVGPRPLSGSGLNGESAGHSFPLLLPVLMLSVSQINKPFKSLFFKDFIYLFLRESKHQHKHRQGEW